MVEGQPIGNPYPQVSGEVAGNPYSSGPGKYHEFLGKMIKNNAYNVYCVDCKKNQSTHVSFFFGVFICADCAVIHRAELGMDKSYVKAINEIFDDFQISYFKEGVGGNYSFHEFMKEYKMEAFPIHKKYNSRPAKFYKKKLLFQVEGRVLQEAPPNKELENIQHNVTETSKEVITKTNEAVGALGEKIGSWFKK